MKIVVIDGQGGRMGSAFIDKWIKSGGDPKELIAVGTNAMATSAMMKAVASCTAQKVLLPVNTCMFHVVGVSDNRLSDNIDEAITYILQNK